MFFLWNASSYCLEVKSGKDFISLCLDSTKNLAQIISGCDCCELDGDLVPDGFKWDINGESDGTN